LDKFVIMFCINFRSKKRLYTNTCGRCLSNRRILSEWRKM